MTHAIVGFGSIGQALARTFARQGLPVQVASRRPPAELSPQAAEIGASITPVTLAEALEADIIFLCIPFADRAALGTLRRDWSGRVVVDVTNAFGVAPEALDGLTSSEAVARALPGVRLVKGFNHLAAKVLASDPGANGGRRVVFLAGDDADATATVAALAERLGFAPVRLGELAQGGALVQARGREWGPLIFQDLIKLGAAA